MINICDICKDANTIGISGHINPDGDCVGSTMGLYQFLSKVYGDKQIDVYLQTPSDTLSMIKGVEQIQDLSEAEAEEKAKNTEYDVFFVLDSVPEHDRIGASFHFYEKAKYTVNVDHHITNPGVGNACYIDAKASSASELVYDLITFADPDKKYMDRELAMTIYLGIIQDCGVFQYSNTSPKTLRIAADLISYGFDFPKLIEESFYQKTDVQNKVLAFAIEKCKAFFSGAFLASYVTLQDMAKLGATKYDFEGVVNQLRYTKGCKVAAVLRETEEGTFKVSLRSGGEVDVSKVCATFAGGGHVRASGCTISEDPENILVMLAGEIGKQLT